MANVILGQEAIADLNSICDYIFAKWSKKQADHYDATVKMACYGINKNLLALKSGKHLIFYRQMPNDSIATI